MLRSAGADLAFRSDHAALVIVEQNDTRFRAIDFAELRPERGKPLVPSAVCRAFAERMKLFGVPAVCVDSFYLESAREHFGEHGIEIVEAPGGQTGKTQTHLVVRTLMNERRLSSATNLRLRAQLKELVSKPTPGGGLAISSPRRGKGGHSDLCSAWVLAVWLADRNAQYAGDGEATFLVSDSRWDSHSRGF